MGGPGRAWRLPDDGRGRMTRDTRMSHRTRDDARVSTATDLDLDDPDVRQHPPGLAGRGGGHRRAATALGVSELLGGTPAGRDVARRRGRTGRHRPPAAGRQGLRRDASSGPTTSSRSSCSSWPSRCSSAPVSGSCARRHYARRRARVRRLRRRSGSSPRSAIRWRTRAWSRSSAAVSVGVGLWVLGWLLGPLARVAAATATGADAPARRCPTGRAARSSSGPARVGVGAVVAGVAGRHLLDRQRGRARSAPGRPIPPASETVPPLARRGGPVADGRRPDPDRHAERPASTGSTPRCSRRASTPRLDPAHPRPRRSRDDADLGRSSSRCRCSSST